MNQLTNTARAALLFSYNRGDGKSSEILTEFRSVLVTAAHTGIAAHAAATAEVLRRRGG
jgi:hypothetical protein